ncbi:hypothetical protein [Minwuia thermotolerans]|nr:hypothetical protein [Minwuia thermotolerans]
MFTIALFALFAAGLVLNSAAMASMSLKMALGDIGAVEMADCQDCGAVDDGEDNLLTCDIDCTISFAAHLGQGDSYSPRIAESGTSPKTNHLTGRVGQPDPYPPRLLI